jgi:hypothetical protein
MKTFISICVVSLIIFITRPVLGDLIRIPEDFSTIQTGIDQAQALDTVLVAPGVYIESLVFNGKTLTLASWFLTTADTSYIRTTIIDGNDGEAVIIIDDAVGPQTTIIGFTLQNADDGIAPSAKFNLLNNRIIDCSDGIDYEDYSGGLCRENVFEFNSDDGIDLDDYIDIVIEKNIIRHNDDDGIEIRLEDYSGSTLTCIIRENSIYGNGEDGIQLIDYQEVSDRIFIIDRNLIYDNTMAGLGCMSDENTEENYEGAGIREPVYLYNNTFVNNTFGVTGGENLIALNNIFMQHTDTAMKNVDGNSLIAYSVYWENGVDFENCNTDTSLFLINPLLDNNFLPMANSPCIDRGTAFFIWQDSIVFDLPAADYKGQAPDIGAVESDDSPTLVEKQVVGVPQFHLFANYPNPFNPETRIRYHIGSPGRVKILIFDINGRLIATLADGFHASGEYEIKWQAHEANGRFLPSGIYFCKVQENEQVQILKMTLIK